jgi:hypothetical protein
MTDCTFCGQPISTGADAHWRCGGILPDDPRHSAISVADHIVRLLTPKRKFTNNGYRAQRTEPLTRDSLRARLRPELVEYANDGIELALAARRIECDAGGVLTLARARAPRARAVDDGSAAGLFELPPDARSRGGIR